MLAVSLPSGSFVTDQDRARPEFWLDHAQRYTGVAAMHSSTKWRRYHAWTRRMLQDWTLRRVRAAARAPYLRFADLGCGIGDWTELLSQVAVDTYACDVSPTFVATTRARVPTAQVTCADLRTYQLPADLDLVYVGAVLMYLPDADVRSLLRRIRAAARRDAIVIVRDYGPINLGRASVNARDGFLACIGRHGCSNGSPRTRFCPASNAARPRASTARCWHAARRYNGHFAPSGDWAPRTGAARATR
jgi:SAM-dependent methyltransferase